jgi:hypothetical protein
MSKVHCALVFSWLALFAASSSSSAATCDGDCPVDLPTKEDSDSASLLQVKSDVHVHGSVGSSKHDLVFLHMPYNFGNTIEKVAMFPPETSRIEVIGLAMSMGGGSFANPQGNNVPSWDYIKSITKPGGENWGHFNPDLMVEAKNPKCPLYLTPPKYWPEAVAKKYFGDKKIFAVIRDPYEKLIAQFRGAMPDYGGSATEKTMKECDVNTAIKTLLKNIEATNDTSIGGCVNIPQAEWFDGKYGVQIPVDNWRFPKSANELFEKHGYSWHIRKQDVLHVSLCEDHWSAELDTETRNLVKKIYKKDFELICKHFGHCDFEQNTCLQGVHHMCPYSEFTWDPDREIYCPKEGVVKRNNVRQRDECMAENFAMG